MRAHTRAHTLHTHAHTCLCSQVTFVAEQITKEMQGIRVSGFVVWSIHRDGDGPLKAYRYLDSLSESGQGLATHKGAWARAVSCSWAPLTPSLVTGRTGPGAVSG